MSKILICLIMIQLANAGIHFDWFTWVVFGLVFIQAGYETFCETFRSSAVDGAKK